MKKTTIKISCDDGTERIIETDMPESKKELANMIYEKYRKLPNGPKREFLWRMERKIMDSPDVTTPEKMQKWLDANYKKTIVNLGDL